MSLQRLLRLLPIGLVVLVVLNLAMMLVQDRQSRETFGQVRIAQTQRDVLGKIRTNCEALTFKAVAWTLTRRSSQGRVTKWRASSGSVAPISVVGTISRPAEAMNRSTDSSA